MHAFYKSGCVEISVALHKLVLEDNAMVVIKQFMNEFSQLLKRFQTHSNLQG